MKNKEKIWAIDERLEKISNLKWVSDVAEFFESEFKWINLDDIFKLSNDRVQFKYDKEGIIGKIKQINNISDLGNSFLEWFDSKIDERYGEDNLIYDDILRIKNILSSLDVNKNKLLDKAWIDKEDIDFDLENWKELGVGYTRWYQIADNFNTFKMYETVDNVKKSIKEKVWKNIWKIALVAALLWLWWYGLNSVVNSNDDNDWYGKTELIKKWERLWWINFSDILWYYWKEWLSKIFTDDKMNGLKDALKNKTKKWERNVNDDIIKILEDLIWEDINDNKNVIKKLQAIIWLDKKSQDWFCWKWTLSWLSNFLKDWNKNDKKVESDILYKTDKVNVSDEKKNTIELWNQLDRFEKDVDWEMEKFDVRIDEIKIWINKWLYKLKIDDNLGDSWDDYIILKRLPTKDEYKKIKDFYKGNWDLDNIKLWDLVSDKKIIDTETINNIKSVEMLELALRDPWLFFSRDAKNDLSNVLIQKKWINFVLHAQEISKIDLTSWKNIPTWEYKYGLIADWSGLIIDDEIDFDIKNILKIKKGELWKSK